MELMKNGKCIVAGDGRLFNGSVCGFITGRPADGAVGCTELKLDLPGLLKARWVRKIVEHHVDSLNTQSNELQSIADELRQLFTAHHVLTAEDVRASLKIAADVRASLKIAADNKMTQKVNTGFVPTGQCGVIVGLSHQKTSVGPDAPRSVVVSRNAVFKTVTVRSVSNDGTNVRELNDSELTGVITGLINGGVPVYNGPIEKISSTLIDKYPDKEAL